MHGLSQPIFRPVSPARVNPRAEMRSRMSKIVPRNRWGRRIGTAALIAAALFHPALASRAAAFAHPEGLYTALDYWDILLTAALGFEPWSTADQDLLAQASVAVEREPQPVLELQTPIYDIDDPENQAQADAQTKGLRDDVYAAYTCALAFELNGDQACLEKAIEILDAWARVNRVPSQQHTTLAWMTIGSGFLLAAETLRGSGAWAQADFDRFRGWADRIYRPAMNECLSRSNNWRSWGVFGQVLYAHLFDNATLFNSGIATLRDQINGSIEWSGRQPLEIARGTNGLWYSYFSLSALTAAAQVVRNTSGIDLFSGTSTEAQKLKKGLQYTFYYAQHPYKWPDASLANFDLWSYQKYPLDLFETMGGVYGIAEFANYAAPYRTIFGGMARSPNNPSHFAWNFPTLMLPVDNSTLTASDNFDDGDTSDWSVVHGDWSVVRARSEQGLYNQSNPNAYGAMTTMASGTGKDLELKAQMTINWMGTPGQAGLLARYTDPNNWVRFVVDRPMSQVRIEMARQGTVSTISSAPYTSALGWLYNLQASLNGQRLKFFINGDLVTEGFALDSPVGSGDRVGLYTHRSDTTFDAVRVKPPQLANQDFSAGAANFTVVKGTWNVIVESGSDIGNRLYRQSSMTSMATAAVGDINWQNYRADTSVFVNSFQTGQPSGVGLYARYRDANNYYNFHVYKYETGALELRIEKRFDGVVTVLKSIPFNMQTGTWYRMGAEVAGSRLRMYVDDRLLLEANDTQLYNGQIALDAHRTNALFDNVEVN